jgi:hypothetical protein
MKHTPGPWRRVNHIIKHGPDYVAIVLCEQFTKEDQANADLIAAAPELLEALEEMYKVCNLSSDSSPHRAKALAAINKATGQS